MTGVTTEAVHEDDVNLRRIGAVDLREAVRLDFVGVRHEEDYYGTKTGREVRTKEETGRKEEEMV